MAVGWRGRAAAGRGGSAAAGCALGEPAQPEAEREGGEVARARARRSRLYS